MKKIKHILGINAHWTINKQLSKTIGLYETILLQHLIDLQESFFEDGGFYQQDDRLLKDLPFSIHHIKQARSILKEKELITVKSKGLPAKNHYTVNVDKVLELIGLKYIDNNEDNQSPPSQSPGTSLDSHQELGNTNNLNNTNNKETNIDVPSVDIDIKDVYGKIFFKIVEAYPKNRIGNRQHGLKKFNTLSIEEAKLAAINLKRYLKVAGSFVKSLQNYIDQQCFTEAWLKAEELNQKSKNQKQNDTTNNAKSFSNRDVTFF
jgi:hypothetical protein